MEIEYLGTTGDWRDIADAARTTVNMDKGEGEPSSEWKFRMLKAEHSPIRKMSLQWKWKKLKTWISTHFVRHKIGIEHFVRSQRTDRTGVDRSEKTQDALIEHECDANFQAIINISRKRLCRKSAFETRQAWFRFLDEIVKPNEPELYNVCVPECVYRGHCPELESCGYVEEREYVIQEEYYQNQ